MTVRIAPGSLISREFGGLEAADPGWMKELPYWEDYNHRYFRANGESYHPPTDSNVETWLTAPDRAPYAAMTKELLKDLSDRMDLSDIDLVLLAHWLPDIHLGTSVTNFALHHLGVQGGFGFAISDRGRTAPLFALQCAARYLRNGRRKALVLAMDQKHLLYRSPVVEVLNPVNSAAALVLEHSEEAGLYYSDYRRMPLSEGADLSEAVATLCAEMGHAPQDTCLIAESDLMNRLVHTGPTHATPAGFLCAGPFAGLEAISAGQEAAAYLLLAVERHGLSAVMVCPQTQGVPA